MSINSFESIKLIYVWEEKRQKSVLIHDWTAISNWFSCREPADITDTCNQGQLPTHMNGKYAVTAYKVVTAMDRQTRLSIRHVR
jgi:hypothetical protein